MGGRQALGQWLAWSSEVRLIWGRCEGGSFAKALMRGLPADGTLRKLSLSQRRGGPVWKSLVVMAVDSMLRRANGAQAGIQRLHDQALVGAERSRVGIRLGLLP